MPGQGSHRPLETPLPTQARQFQRIAAITAAQDAREEERRRAEARTKGAQRDLEKPAEDIRVKADDAGVSRTNFQALNHGANASEAAADAEMAQAELDVQAEATC